MIEVQASNLSVNRFSGCCGLPRSLRQERNHLVPEMGSTHFLVCLSFGLMSICFLLPANKSHTQSLRCRRSVISSLKVSQCYYLHDWRLTTGEPWAKAFLVSECHFERHTGAENVFLPSAPVKYRSHLGGGERVSLVSNPII